MAELRTEEMFKAAWDLVCQGGPVYIVAVNFHQALSLRQDMSSVYRGQGISTETARCIRTSTGQVCFSGHNDFERFMRGRQIGPIFRCLADHPLRAIVRDEFWELVSGLQVFPSLPSAPPPPTRFERLLRDD